ncbi:MAG: hypothetical protein AAF298_18930 [Cyanobacteria bacterium P01_A01_bin.40]
MRGKSFPSRQLIEIIDIPQTRVPSYSTIRQHWSIENCRHWVKDVVTKEDTSHQLLGQAATNISLIKSWVLNLLRIHGYDSMTEALSHLSHNLPLLLSFCH